MTQLARVGIIRFGGHQSVTEVDSLVFKAIVACLFNCICTYVWPMCFFFVSVPFFYLACLFKG